MPTMLTELGQQELCEWQDSGGADQRLMGTRAPQRWNTECISGSSLPFCRRRDRPRWGKRLIEGLACIRMWLLIEVWGECHSLRLYLPPPSVSQPPSSTKHLSPACSTLTLFLDEHWYPPPPTTTTSSTSTTLQHLSASFRCPSSPHAASVNACFPVLPSPLADTHTAPPPVLLPLFFSSPEGRSRCRWSLKGRESEKGQWQGRAGKVAFIWSKCFRQFTKRQSTIGRHRLMMWSDGMI